MTDNVLPDGTLVTHRVTKKTGKVVRSYKNVRGQLTYDVQVDGNTRSDGRVRWLASAIRGDTKSKYWRNS